MPSDITSEWDSASCVMHSVPETPDALRNDYQHARVRTLHGWAQWRTKMNNHLCQTTVHGHPLPEKLAPINSFLQKQLPRYHPAENPKTLLSYSAAQDSQSHLRRNHYLIYGLPRVKLDQRKECWQGVIIPRDPETFVDNLDQRVMTIHSEHEVKPAKRNSQPQKHGVKADVTLTRDKHRSRGNSSPHRRRAASPQRRRRPDYETTSKSTMDLRDKPQVEFDTDVVKSMMNLNLGYFEGADEDVPAPRDRREAASPRGPSVTGLPRTPANKGDANLPAFPDPYMTSSYIPRTLVHL